MPRSRAWFDAQFRLAPADDLVSRFQYMDVNSYLTYAILAKVDIASMCHSLEVRVPLIDHVFTDVISRIPARLKVKSPSAGTLRDDVPLDSLTGKYLLKKNGERFFSHDFLNRRKRGFDVPIKNWIADSARDETRERLIGSPLLNELFTGEMIGEMLRSHGRGADHGWRLWSLLVLDEWLSQHRGSRRGVLRE
jgi:asparagine synthase (glutamine-hydrolysing)